jgi:hypothetical protein
VSAATLRSDDIPRHPFNNLLGQLTKLLNRAGRDHLLNGVARMEARAPKSGVLAWRSARA